MTPTVRVEPSDWLSFASALVALPHGLRHDSFAQHVTHSLLDAKGSEVKRILDMNSSAVRVKSWEKLLRPASEAELREFFSYRPKDAVCVFATQLPELRRWSTLVEICEACYLISRQGGSEANSGDDLPFASRLSAARLARTRWALLSLPFARSGRPLYNDVLRVDDEPGRLLVLAQQARDDWLSVLASIDDYPQLTGLIGDVEQDAVMLVASRITAAALGSGVATVDDGEVGSDPVGQEVGRFVATRLLLPRFAWMTTAGIYLRSTGVFSRVLSAAACAAVIATLVQLALGFWLHRTWEYTAAAGTAAAVYLLVVAAMAADSRAAWPWLLRQPASAAVGLLALAAFGPGWWFTGGVPGGTARAIGVIIGLVGAAFVYLYIEAIGHGVRGSRLARRPPLIGIFGFIHGLLVSLIGLRFLLPTFAAGPARGPALSCWYAARSCHGMALPVPALLALAAAWSLAAGVFLQIIWDDQPVTAPLAHVTWRRGG